MKPWRLIPIDSIPVVYKPECNPTVRCHTQPIDVTTGPTSSISTDLRLDFIEKQELEDMTKQLPADLEALVPSQSPTNPPIILQHPPKISITLKTTLDESKHHVTFWGPL